MQPKVESRLQRALESDAKPEELIGIVLSFEPPAASESSGIVPLVERREQRAAVMLKTIAQALARAGEITGIQPTKVTPFPLTGSAFVQAPRHYVRALLAQNGVAGAMLNSESSNP